MLRSHGALARGVYIRYARTGEISGVRYYLLLAAQLNGRGPVPSRCYAEQRAAFHHRATHFPPDQRSAAMRYEDGALQTQRASSQPVGVCCT